MVSRTAAAADEHAHRAKCTLQTRAAPSSPFFWGGGGEEGNRKGKAGPEFICSSHQQGGPSTRPQTPSLKSVEVCGRQTSASFIGLEADTSCPSHYAVTQCQLSQPVSGTAMGQPPREAVLLPRVADDTSPSSPGSLPPLSPTPPRSNTKGPSIMPAD